MFCTGWECSHLWLWRLESSESKFDRAWLTIPAKVDGCHHSAPDHNLLLRLPFLNERCRAMSAMNLLPWLLFARVNFQWAIWCGRKDRLSLAVNIHKPDLSSQLVCCHKKWLEQQLPPSQLSRLESKRWSGCAGTAAWLKVKWNTKIFDAKKVWYMYSSP